MKRNTTIALLGTTMLASTALVAPAQAGGTCDSGAKFSSDHQQIKQFNPNSLSPYQEDWVKCFRGKEKAGVLGSLFWANINDKIYSFPLSDIQGNSRDSRMDYVRGRLAGMIEADFAEDNKAFMDARKMFDSFVEKGADEEMAIAAVSVVVDDAVVAQLQSALAAQKAKVAQLEGQISALESLRVDDAKVIAARDNTIASLEADLAAINNTGYASEKAAYDAGVIAGGGTPLTIKKVALSVTGNVTVTFSDDTTTTLLAANAGANSYLAGHSAGVNSVDTSHDVTIGDHTFTVTGNASHAVTTNAEGEIFVGGQKVGSYTPVVDGQADTYTLSVGGNQQGPAGASITVNSNTSLIATAGNGNVQLTVEDGNDTLFFYDVYTPNSASIGTAITQPTNVQDAEPGDLNGTLYLRSTINSENFISSVPGEEIYANGELIQLGNDFYTITRVNDSGTIYYQLTAATINVGDHYGNSTDGWNIWTGSEFISVQGANINAAVVSALEDAAAPLSFIADHEQTVTFQAGWDFEIGGYQLGLLIHNAGAGYGNYLTEWFTPNGVVFRAPTQAAPSVDEYFITTGFAANATIVERLEGYEGSHLSTTKGDYFFLDNGNLAVFTGTAADGGKGWQVSGVYTGIEGKDIDDFALSDHYVYTVTGASHEFRFGTQGVTLGTAFQPSAADYDKLSGFIEDALEDAYDDGYDDGYADGYADGFADGVASVLND